MAEKIYNAANPAHIKLRREQVSDVQEQQTLDLRALLKLPEFRRYVWRHMNETCGLLQTPSSGNGSMQSHQVGMQDVARKLWAEIERIDPLVIPEMMVEHYEAVRQRK